MLKKLYIIILLSFVSAERIGFFTAPQESALGFWIGTEFSDNEIVDLDKDVESINISYITSSNFEINIERVVQFFDYDIDIYGNTFILPSVNYRNEISYYSLGLYYYFKSDLYDGSNIALGLGLNSVNRYSFWGPSSNALWLSELNQIEESSISAYHFEIIYYQKNKFISLHHSREEAADSIGYIGFSEPEVPDEVTKVGADLESNYLSFGFYNEIYNNIYFSLSYKTDIETIDVIKDGFLNINLGLRIL